MRVTPQVISIYLIIRGSHHCAIHLNFSKIFSWSTFFWKGTYVTVKWILKYLQCSIIWFSRGADLELSLKSAATCVGWKTKDAVTLINSCGGLNQNWDILFEVSHGFIDYQLLLSKSIILKSNSGRVWWPWTLTFWVRLLNIHNFHVTWRLISSSAYWYIHMHEHCKADGCYTLANSDCGRVNSFDYHVDGVMRSPQSWNGWQIEPKSKLYW